MEFTPGPAVHRVLCADCGTPIVPNSANLCVACLRNTIDITEGIPKQTSVAFCRNCERFLSPPGGWTIAKPESSELLAICLKKLKGLSKVRLTDARFIWTEPHSKRLKVALTIQKEVLTNTILEQTFEIEYLVQYGQCPDCARLAAKNTWRAMVQVRQKVSHKRTFLFLEQLILKHNAQKDTISIKEVRDGLDFFYSTRSHALKMVEFLGGVVPIRSKSAEQIISSDTHTSTANFKYTYSVEIVPVCKDDLVCLPLKQARSLSNISPLTLCTRVGNSLQLLDPSTLQTAEIPATLYWRSPFDSLAAVTDLVEFTVLDIEPDRTKTRGKWVMADAQVALSGAFKSSKHRHDDSMMMDYEGNGGAPTMIFHTRTHLGAILQPGDSAMGYYVSNSNFNSDAFTELPSDRIPDVILVKKAYPNRRKKHSNKARNWKLRSIAKEAGEDGDTGGARGAIGRMGGRDAKKIEEDYELFLREIEEDPDLRAAVNLYKADVKMDTTDGAAKTRKKGGQYSMDVDEVQESTDDDHDENEADFPEIKIEELLDEFDEMTLNAGEGVEEETPAAN
ncbi:RNA binding protein [Coprinopsis cinerea okayama7|uniref:60S ribosomal export protein NMD3 n=1 Tax=Coprinopsis cinerea (strain Okayama-7 / 130 / ATCC MYA-4618 / FGSC 9003) TaxID=240176 RepID=A8NCR7_COPC7|nr:60S ribosomal export protein NMD3 [Coprinopsis cinerea okayama7\|eukprot:XP_001832610.1 60S ribosomal export protein NMD3 [Coprinopsis cinerea okayama7\